MTTKYVTRNGLIANIDGISEYRSFGEDHIMLSGQVEGQDCAWDKYGRYRTSRVLGINEPHSLDLVSWVDESINK